MFGKCTFGGNYDSQVYGQHDFLLCGYSQGGSGLNFQQLIVLSLQNVGETSV